ncbi:hypothetical protein C8A01DRAFT_50381 [Parachaetomium inaequale]|uniref:Ubiquitin 3 binding protein But2 C-terminal domain-containing protein n=1 Tax=Parachaetomium inaequale TaxID=2588326 RepID=A0AAN6PAW2_9PEZI|nr:hypothetical protein C8A01DRAFT_50381 [Parachaetomium inaequale]
MFLTSSQTLSLLLALTPSAISASILPRLNNVTVTSVSAHGLGCPEGTLSSNINPDKTTVTFGFDEFQAYLGPGYSVIEKSQTCTITLSLSYPPGSTFKITDAVYHGSARLDAGMSANIRSSYRITSDEAGGSAAQTQASAAGELLGVYTRTDTIPSSSRIGSACGRGEAVLQITTRIAVTSSSASVSGNVDDEPVFSLGVQQLGLEWSACET